MALTAFNAGATGAPNMPGLVILRFFGGAFGSLPLTNAGGVIADMFPASKRVSATSIFALAPFLGPALGPIAGGFLGQAAGWRWVMGMTKIFTGILWILNSLVCPETYAPVLLRKRAAALSRVTGKVYVYKLDRNVPAKSLASQFGSALLRPWVLFFKKHIIFLTSLYMAIIYGTLYMCLAAFPIVFRQGRGWSAGISGLAFVGIAVGMTLATMATVFDNKRYMRVAARGNGIAPSEARLPPALVGSIFLPVGLFWFAWTNGPSIHWAVPIVGSTFFAAGIVLVFLALMNYLVDSCPLTHPLSAGLHWAWPTVRPQTSSTPPRSSPPTRSCVPSLAQSFPCSPRTCTTVSGTIGLHPSRPSLPSPACLFRSCSKNTKPGFG